MKALVLLVGREGGGKSLYMAWLIARITTGKYGKPRRVLILGAEDDWEEDWLPRLIAAGADLSQIGYDASYTTQDEAGDAFLDPLHLGSTAVQDELALAMKEHGYDVLILDHLDIALPSGSKSKDYEDMGRALRRLHQWSKQNWFAVLAGWHMSKGTGPTQDKTIGSVAIRGSVRALWMLAPNSEDGLIYVALEKGNGLNLNRKALSFAVSGTVIDGGIETVVASGVTEAVHPGTGKEYVAQLIELASQPPKPTDAEGKKLSAEQWLEALLQDGPKMRRFVVGLAEQSGFSESSVEKAARRLKVTSQLLGKEAAWSLDGVKTSSVPGDTQGVTDVTDERPTPATPVTSVTSVTGSDVRNPLNTPAAEDVNGHKSRRPLTGTDVPSGTDVDLTLLEGRLLA